MNSEAQDQEICCVTVGHSGIQAYERVENLVNGCVLFAVSNR